MEAETQKSECAREHQKAAVLFHEAEKKVQQLEEKYLRSINKARPYFDLKEKFDQKLALQKEVVDCLKKAVKDAKCSYATSLRALEEISNQIHEKRRDYGKLFLKISKKQKQKLIINFYKRYINYRTTRAWRRSRTVR